MLICGNYSTLQNRNNFGGFHAKILQECERCIAVKEELQSVKDHNEELLETVQERNRSVIIYYLHYRKINIISIHFKMFHHYLILIFLDVFLR